MKKHTLAMKNISVDTAGREVVSGVTLDLKSGEIHILMGPNGSGKSSLVNALMGHPRRNMTNGSVLFDGKDITELSPDKKAAEGLFLSLQHLPEVGGVSLMHFLRQAYNKSHGQNVSVMEFYDMAKKKAERIGISSAYLEKPLNEGLSGGEKKQSELFQLIALEPKFAFLDEIDSGVDPDSLGKVCKGVIALKNEGTGFLLITHYPSILSHIMPDKVHVMKEGRLVASGGHELAERIAKDGFEKIA